jgi:hypothetical protein
MMMMEGGVASACRARGFARSFNMQCLPQPVVLWGTHIGRCRLLLLLLLLLPGNAPLNVGISSTSHALPQPGLLRRLHIGSSKWLLLLLLPHTLASVVSASKCTRAR